MNVKKKISYFHVNCFRSIASWFDEGGVLLFDNFLNDIKEMYKSLKKEKAQ